VPLALQILDDEIWSLARSNFRRRRLALLREKVSELHHESPTVDDISEFTEPIEEPLSRQRNAKIVAQDFFLMWVNASKIQSDPPVARDSRREVVVEASPKNGRAMRATTSRAL
jgi:hypothetical protein